MRAAATMIAPAAKARWRSRCSACYIASGLGASSRIYTSPKELASILVCRDGVHGRPEPMAMR